jgi:hypothetical protein
VFDYNLQSSMYKLNSINYSVTQKMGVYILSFVFQELNQENYDTVLIL